MFELISDTEAHSDDVKDIKYFTNGCTRYIASGSRDGSVKIWIIENNNHQCVKIGEHREHNGFVNAIAIGKYRRDDDTLIVASGGADGIIYLWHVEESRLVGTLVGHKGNICFLQLCPNGLLLSCSWDKTARLWDGLQCVGILEGHDEALWSCCLTSEQKILTGSADKTIMLWSGGKCIRIYSGHSDVVRSVIDLGEDFEEFGDFASAGNDGLINFWTLGGRCSLTINAHDSFIYTIKVHREHLFSAGEDRTIKVWRKTNDKISCIQSIPIPTISIWSLDTTEEGEIICGCSDGHIYVFSPHKSNNPVDTYILANFHERLRNSQVSRVTMPQSASSEEELLEPGQRAGQTKLIKKDARTEVYQWNGAKWEKIGDVVEGPGTQSKTLYNGKEYDFVFEVELEDGGPKLKIPFNYGDNPYSVAMQFLTDHNLRPYFLDQIVDFIMKNTSAKVIESSKDLFNPYTLPNTITKNSTKVSKLYTEANIAGIIKKIQEFSALEDEKISEIALDNLRLNLETTKVGSSKGGETEMLTGMLNGWKPEHSFPLFDALRMLVLKGHDLLDSQLDLIISKLKSLDRQSASLLTSSRLIYNLLQNPRYVGYIIRYPEDCASLIQECFSTKIKDTLLPSKLILEFSEAAMSINKASTATKSLFPIILSRIRNVMVQEEMKNLLRSLQLMATDLNGRHKSIACSEIDVALSSGVDWEQNIIKLMQQTQELLHL